MSSRYWLLGCAIGGWLALSPTLGQEGAGNKEPVKQEAKKDPDRDAQPPEDANGAIFWKDRRGGPETYGAICEAPADNTQADLCQQWRAANAAIKSSDWVFPQFIASVLGIAGLIWTIVLGHRATKAGIKAANAAEVAAKAATETVNAMRDIDERQSAAFLLSLAISKQAADASDLSAKALIGVELANLHIVSVAPMGGQRDPKKWIATFMPEIVIENYGRTPAFIIGVTTNKKVSRILPPDPSYAEFTEFPTRFVIPGGARHTHTDPVADVRGLLTSDDCARFLSGKDDLFVYGVVRFRDFLGAYRQKGFVFSTRMGMSSFFDAGRIYTTYDYHKMDNSQNHNTNSPSYWPP